MSLAHATRDNPGRCPSHRQRRRSLETAASWPPCSPAKASARPRAAPAAGRTGTVLPLGLWGIAVPREYGGAGVSRVTLVVAIVSAASTIPGADSAEPFLRPRSAAGERLAGAEGRLFGAAWPASDAQRLAEIGTRTASERRATCTRRRRRLPPGRAQVLPAPAHSTRSGCRPWRWTTRPPATGLRRATAPGRRRRLVRLRSTHRRRFGAVRPGSSGRRGRGRSRTPSSARPPSTRWRRSSTRRSTPGSPAAPSRTPCVSSASAPGPGSTRRRQGRRRPTDHPRDRPPGDRTPKRWAVPGRCSTGPPPSRT